MSFPTNSTTPAVPATLHATPAPPAASPAASPAVLDPTDSSNGLIVFQSATYLYLKQIFSLQGAHELPIFYENPGDTPTVVLQELYQHVMVVMTNFGQSPFTPNSMNESATPGMFLMADLLNYLIEDRQLGDYQVLCARNYLDIDGVGHKISWASGLVKEINGTRDENALTCVIDLGGNGTLKCMDATTGEELDNFENVPHEKWCETIRTFLTSSSMNPETVALSYTGKLREGHPDRHDYAETAISNLKTTFPSLYVSELSPEKERKWENASAVEAVAALVPKETRYEKIFNVASGSSTTQMGMYLCGPQIYAGNTYNMGIHLKLATLLKQIAHAGGADELDRQTTLDEVFSQESARFNAELRIFSKPLLVPSAPEKP